MYQIKINDKPIIRMNAKSKYDAVARFKRQWPNQRGIVTAEKCMSDGCVIAGVWA